VSIHRIVKGLDIPLAGAPLQDAVEAAPAAAHVGWVAADFPGLKPSVLVEPGARVLRGTPIVADKRNPGVVHTAPAAGVVTAVHRAERRRLLSVVIAVDADDGPARQVPLRGARAGTATAAEVRELMVASGLWTALRMRPFSRVPAADGVPHALFVTAMDTRPHAPDPAVVIKARANDFAAGVAALATLGAGTTYVCVAAGAGIEVPATDTIRVESFAGPHPAGTAGLHIATLAPVSAGRTAWHIGYQDVIALGRLLTTGELDVARVVSLAGPGAARPRLVRMRLGAALGATARLEAAAGEQRVVSGSALDGRAASEADGYLGRYHLQVTLIPEGRRRELFGWIAPGGEKFSALGVVLGAWRRRPLRLTTTRNGGGRAMVPVGAYERVMPFDILPTHFLRALITGDDESAEALGALELDEEDLALCTFVCPGKIEYGPLLRDTLERIEKASA
jgi:Na+-transporting NADH:ubiquinone oxidoreductase subunit A